MPKNINLINSLKSSLLWTGLSKNIADGLTALILFVLIIFLAWISKKIVRKFFFNPTQKIIAKTNTKWDDAILSKHVLSRLSNLAPALVVYYTIGIAFAEFPFWATIGQAIVSIYAIVVIFMAIESLIDVFYDIYNTLPISKGRPIKGYLQVVKISLYFLATILILSIILNKDLKYFFTGLGAIAAVLMLVFKDTILGFVASIQLSANDMVQIGDWISMPSCNADGNVEEISLNTVKVRNWDKTISTIPTYQLVSESFSNWRGMQQSGGRRIKRSIFIDMNSVRFANNEMIEKFRNIQLISVYINEKLLEIEEDNREKKVDKSNTINGRNITNLGTFRKYLELFLKNNSKIRKDMTLLVRHLQPTEKGLPIEIYAFSNDTKWGHYEGIQADIFDHIIAAIPQFDLRVFQNPTGDDFKRAFPSQ